MPKQQVNTSFSYRFVNSEELDIQQRLDHSVLRPPEIEGSHRLHSTRTSARKIHLRIARILQGAAAIGAKTQ